MTPGSGGMPLFGTPLRMNGLPEVLPMYFLVEARYRYFCPSGEDPNFALVGLVCRCRRLPHQDKSSGDRCGMSILLST